MDMTADEYLDQDIREEFAKHNSIFRTARTLGITLDRVTRVVGKEDFHVDHKPAKYGGGGRPELEKYLVATKHANDSWDNSTPELKHARARYEAGTHEMCQGRDGDNIILYCIPRAIPDPRPGYFKHGDY
jgi:hypothetical protein